MPQKIYFDESGFTGNKLMDDSQPYFAYASVATDDKEAEEFVEKSIKEYRFQGRELKGRSLLTYNKGRRFIETVFKEFEGRIKVSLSNKKYALACNFFEYIFEPCVSENNSVFYGVDFHKFIANILYLEFRTSNANAEDIFRDFEKSMRDLKFEGSASFFSRIGDNGTGVLESITEFALLNKNKIISEAAYLKDICTSKWILDLTYTSLYRLLSHWCIDFDQVTAICDQSKVLASHADLFKEMINREEKVFSSAFGESEPITFNLSGPIQFADSKTSYGIQIADVLAAAFVFIASNPRDDFSKKWCHLIPKVAHYGSIVPDLDYVNLNEPSVVRNSILLHELCRRSRDGEDLCEGIVDKIKEITFAAALFKLSNPI